jgi:hypothetical protein
MRTNVEGVEVINVEVTLWIPTILVARGLSGQQYAWIDKRGWLLTSIQRVINAEEDSESGVMGRRWSTVY